ncbi:hypothetical protein FAI40_04680 [Acetobacteraceae bacterium]|nr:hypothetical protein FAI40_04680 [Acetobacteraceae bacterium]
MSETTLIPLSPLPNQIFTLQLQNHLLKLHLYQRTYGLFLDLWIDNVLTLAGRLCLNNTFLLQDKAAPLNGDFIFIDSEGSEDPDYTELGSRFKLYFK